MPDPVRGGFMIDPLILTRMSLDLSSSTIQSSFTSLDVQITCTLCQEALTKRLKDVITRWACISVSPTTLAFVTIFLRDSIAYYLIYTGTISASFWGLFGHVPRIRTRCKAVLPRPYFIFRIGQAVNARFYLIYMTLAMYFMQCILHNQYNNPINCSGSWGGYIAQSYYSLLCVGDATVPFIWGACFSDTS